MIETVLKYLHTLRYLKVQQIVSRLTRGFKAIDTLPAAALGRRKLARPFTPVRLNKRSSFGLGRFVFLNEARTVTDWNDPECSKLWLYNLHYFDDLSSGDAPDRRFEHEALINQWIEKNPVARGNGWEPYTISLRIVNWIKWLLHYGQPSEKQLESLGMQAKVLSQTLETHLLGNHFFANAKALVFAGLYFSGENADSWLERGLQILDQEISEQILDDGGNFELSPMYHATMTADFLDLLSIFSAFQDSRCSGVEKELRRRLPQMISWLSVMSHPDGLVSFFNDSTTKIAPSVADLTDVSKQFEIETGLVPRQSIIHLASTGYFRLNLHDGALIGDVGKVGPDYIPGHAHADSLSFELSVFGRRLIVNCGISQYGSDAERERQRGTAAHSTVEINGENSSEVWGGFRVARRATPFGLEIDESVCRVRCAHDGYHRLTGKPTHWRTFEGVGSGVVITDEIEGEYDDATARFHLHPSVEVRRVDSGSVLLETRAGQVGLDVGEALLDIESSFYCPEFGLRIPTQCLSVSIGSERRLRTRISWGNSLNA